MLHDGLTLKSAGPDKVYNALRKNGVSYSDPDFLASAQKIQELVNSGAFIDGATGLSNDEAVQSSIRAMQLCTSQEAGWAALS
jgi:raffinose/stachyose/melibiose transport system substrate-binding protein